MWTRFVFLLLFFLCGIELLAQEKNSIIEIRGSVISEAGIPLGYANIYVKDTHCGTVSNSKGEFWIKIPADLKEGILVISMLGYESFESKISNLHEGRVDANLKKDPRLLEELVIPDPEKILSEAFKRISKNYPINYQYLTTFYRELIKKNRSYVDISQGVLSVTKTPYTSKNRGFKRINIDKGHRVYRYKKGDTLAFKVMGGPVTMMMLDLAQNPGEVLGEEFLPYYNYSYQGLQFLDGNRCYVFHFEKSEDTEIPLYEGMIYIEENTLAIAKISFGYGENELQYVAKYLVKSKPFLAKVTPLKVRYDVRYRESQGKWHLDYVRSEIEMKVNWKKKLFNSKFNAVCEMVVTNKKPIEEKEARNQMKLNTTNFKDMFSDKARNLYETEYWEDYSIIKPEEDLTKAILKLNKN